MKNKGILIVIVLVIVAIAAYFLLKKKGVASDATVTQTRESTTGVAALFNTAAMGSLFGGFGKAADAVGSAVNVGTNNNSTPTARTEWEEQFKAENGYYPG